MNFLNGLHQESNFLAIVDLLGWGGKVGHPAGCKEGEM